MPIKVLHIIGSLGLGGAQVCLKYLAEHSSDNVEHFIYPLRNDTDIEIKGNIIRFQYPNYDPRKFFAILKLIRKYDIDIVHAHLHKPIIASLLLSYFRRVRVVAHEHGSVAYPGIQYSLYRILLRLLHRNADVFIAVSKTTAKWLGELNIPDEKIKIVYNAVNSSEFNPEKQSQKEARKILGVKSDAIVIGFVGRLVFDKGADLLIEAMSILKKRNIPCMLVLAGEGSQKQHLQRLTADMGLDECVTFLGFRKDVATFIAACDIGVVPSRFEPFGIVALEFMQMKAPMVCSGVDGLAEFIEDGNTALVSSPNMPANIAESIEKLIREPALRRVIAENAYKHVQQFSVAKQVEAINRLYMEVLNVKSEKAK
ncbi:MAG: glycosyltransferase family 4 protein [Phycisphaerae bacterium]|jgi:glycosyltransferase involved in cell wall biosynthesis